MRIAGIKFEKDAKGNNRYVRIDLKQHGEAIAPLLKQLGAADVQADAAYIKEFERKWARRISGDELRKDLHAYIKSLPWKK